MASVRAVLQQQHRSALFQFNIRNTLNEQICVTIKLTYQEYHEIKVIVPLYVLPSSEFKFQGTLDYVSSYLCTS
jgi:hypothetical protein